VSLSRKARRAREAKVAKIAALRVEYAHILRAQGHEAVDPAKWAVEAARIRSRLRNLGGL